MHALDLGADDFVTKPFGVAEFMARVRAALRHRVQMQGGPAIYDDGRLVVDLGKRIVRVDGQDPKLTPREYGLVASTRPARRQGADASPIAAIGLAGRPRRRCPSTARAHAPPAPEDRT